LLRFARKTQDRDFSMSHQVLARKWRPRVFADVIGQEHVVRALTNALDTGRIHHAYLFTGTRGVGKTTLARILAKALNCETGVTSMPCGVCRACREIDAGRFVDLLEVDAATNTKVDEMRELLETAQYAPVTGRYKVYIIDEVHMLSKNAFNAMLKTLEEPPGHVEFVLATTDPQKLPITVLSRCLQFNLKNLPAPLIALHLAKVLDAEGVAYDTRALDMIGRAAEGSARDSLSLLDQAIAHGAGEVRENGVASMLGALDQTYLFTLLNAVARKNPGELLGEIDALAARSVSFDTTLKDIAGILARVALLQQSGEAMADHPDISALRLLAESLPIEGVQLFYQIALLGRRDLSLAPDEQSGFTMTMLRMLAFHPSAGGALKPVTSPSASVISTPSSQAAPEASRTPDACEVPTTVAAGGVSDWPKYVSGLKLSGLAGMLAKHCALKSYENSVLELILPSEQKHLADKGYQDKLRSELALHLGATLRLVITVGNATGQSLADRETRERAQNQSGAESAIAGDPFIQALQRDFGARIIEDSIRPANA
jgi:DNA polymerase-3 subunit gamma/tau